MTLKILDFVIANITVFSASPNFLKTYCLQTNTKVSVKICMVMVYLCAAYGVNLSARTHADFKYNPVKKSAYFYGKISKDTWRNVTVLYR